MERGKTIIPQSTLEAMHQAALAAERGAALARDYARLPARLEALDLALRLATDTGERRRLSDERSEIARALEVQR